MVKRAIHLDGIGLGKKEYKAQEFMKKLKLALDPKNMREALWRMSFRLIFR